MAFITTRIQLGKICCPLNWGCRLLKPLNLKKMAGVAVANIYTKATKDIQEPRPKPWDYEKYGYSTFFALFDKTLKRLDENSKIIIVEGNIASGKTGLAKSLADELDMKYFPETSMDDYYINSSGLDYRDLDSQMPFPCQSFDVVKFYKNPFDKRVARFQIHMLQLRFRCYVRALAHLFNTGQGIILDRSAYSDFVFLETAVHFGYIGKTARNLYNELKVMCLRELMRPHLVIYLDVPTGILMDRIKKRNRKEEINSIVLTPEYIQKISDIYKQKYLKEMDLHSEVLVYDWSDYGDAEGVAEDIERMDFDKFDLYDKKLQDWRLKTEFDWNECRFKYTNEDFLLNSFRIVRYDIPEMLISGEDVVKYEQVLKDNPGWHYSKGYDPRLDKGLLFKNSKE